MNRGGPMSEIKCFKIDDRELSLEHNLVDHNGTPMFFVCVDQEELYYVVLCTDVDDEKYIIVESSVVEIVKLLHQEITMRDMIVSQREYWDIEVGDDISDDVCILKNITNIPLKDLPSEDSIFKVVTLDLINFRDKMIKLNSV